MNNTPISIIIPILNDARFIKRCLNSVFSQDISDAEVIVVGNGVDDSTFIFLKKRYPQIKLLRNCSNMGTSFARNQGIKAASGEYIIFMDSDTTLEGKFFKKLKRIIDKPPPTVSGISPKILQPDAKRIFSCGLRISSLYRAYDIGKGKTSAEFMKPFEIDGPNTCCGIYKRKCLEEIREGKEYFDEDFFFLFEDADLTLRLRKKGHRFLFEPSLISYHDGGSADLSKEYRRYLCFRNRMYMVLKNEKRESLSRFFLRSFTYDFPRTLHFSLTNRYFPIAAMEIYKKFKYEKGTNL